jgi:hypothetical protein
MLEKEQLTPLISHLHQLLHLLGHPPGRLTPQGKKFGKEKRFDGPLAQAADLVW